MQIDSKIAKILGLHKDEVLILQKLTSEPLRIADISKETKIPRTSLYYMLPKLEDRKFITQIKIEKKVYWKKNSDEQILTSYKKIVESISTNTLGETKKVSKDTQITFYHGNDQVINILREVSSLPPHSRFYGIQPESSIIAAVNNNPLDSIIDFNHKVKKSKLIVEGIIHEKGTYSMLQKLSQEEQKRLLGSFSKRAADTAKLPEGYLNSTQAEIYLFKNKIALVNWVEEFAVIIENKDVYDLLKAMFDSTKYMLNKYDQNEKIARKLVELG